MIVILLKFVVSVTDGHCDYFTAPPPANKT